MDGSEISLDLISGSETNVEQLVKQIYQVNLDFEKLVSITKF